jgi:hypothetical protein
MPLCTVSQDRPNYVHLDMSDRLILLSDSSLVVGANIRDCWVARVIMVIRANNSTHNAPSHGL